jgi:streptogramin lyase
MDEQAAAAGVLHKFENAMPARRRRFFRKHKSKAARRRFLHSQQATLKKLEAAAGCAVVPAGASIAATIQVPSDGPLALGLGSVWGEDRGDAQLYRIDPQSNAVTDTIPNVVGAGAAVMNGYVWIASFATDRLLRVDPSTHAVTPFTTGPSNDEAPLDVLPVAGQLWVANHHSGTIALVSPQDGAVSGAISVAPVGFDGAQNLASDGTSVWVGIPGADVHSSAIVRISIANHTVTNTLQGPDSPCGGLAADSSALWVTAGPCDSGGVMRIDPATNQISDYFHVNDYFKPPGVAQDVTIAFGSVWIVTSNPNELVRVDPATNKITGRLALPDSPYAPGIAADSNSLWIRINGAVLRVTPQP